MIGALVRGMGGAAVRSLIGAQRPLPLAFLTLDGDYLTLGGDYLMLRTRVPGALYTGGGLLPVMSGLEAYWDWTGDTPLRSRVGGHLLEQGSGSSVTVVDVTGGPGVKAISLDGSTDFLVIPAASVGRLNLGANGYDACTVFAWVERDDTDAGFVAGCWQEDDEDPRRQYGLFIDLPTYGGTEEVCGHVSKTGGVTPGYPYSRDYSSNARVIDNSKWQFCAFTYDGTEVKSYLGAIFDARPTYTDPLGNTYAKNPYPFADGLNATACDFTVGAVKLTAGMDNFLAGKIGPIGIYNRALSLLELTRLMRASKPSAEPVYEWNFSTAFGPSNVAQNIGWKAATSSADLTSSGTAGNDFGVAQAGSFSYLARGTLGVTGALVGWSGDLDGVSLDDISAVTFLLNSGVTNSLLRLVIKSGDAWYASDETFDLATPGVSGSDWSLAVTKSFTFGRQAAKWRNLTFVPGSSLSLSGSPLTSDIPEGVLQAIGFYSPARPSAAIRIDNLKVFA